MRHLTFALIATVLALGACIDTDTPDSTLTEQVEQAASSNPSHWLVGTWDCVTQYKAQPLAHTTARTANAVYTVTEDGPGGLMHGAYREIVPFPLGDYDDEWKTAPANGDFVPMSYRQFNSSDLRTIEGSGTVRGDFAPSTTILGVDSYFGTMIVQTATGPSSVNVFDGETAVVATATKPARNIRNRRVEFAPGNFIAYLFMDCNLRAK